MTIMRNSVGHAKTRARAWGALCVVVSFQSIFLGVSGCLSDVPVPPCVMEGRSCLAEGGAPTEADGGDRNEATGNGGDAGEATARGGSSPQGGSPSEAGGGGAAPEPSPLAVLPLQLAQPCASRAYQTTLSVAGGQPPYHWALATDVAGWSLHADPLHTELGILQTDLVAPGETSLSIRVEDAAGNIQPVDFTLSARTTCWFAYTALAAGQSTLQLLDPFAEPPSPAALANNSNVYDFRFSPDGRYLAYRFDADTTAPRGRHLSLVDLASLDEQVLSFGEDSITAFAWSADASLLAVGFAIDGESYLNAVRVPAPGSDESPSALARVAAFVESDLQWVGSRFVAFQAELYPDPANPGQFLDNPNHFHRAFSAQLSPDGFEVPQMAAYNFRAGAQLRAAPSGFFMISNLGVGTQYFAVDGSELPADHGTSQLVAPSGKYTATLDGEQLAVASAETGNLASLATSASDACPTLLAWASGVERIACVADVENLDGVTTHGEVRFFDLQLAPNPEDSALTMSPLGGFCDEDTSVVGPGSCAEDLRGYAYGTAQAAGAARAFSDSGRWFAFARVEADRSYIYWADLKQNPARLTRARYLQPQDARTPSAFGFSPDEKRFAFQRGPALLIQDVNQIDAYSMVSIHLPVGEGCSEDFPKAPAAYCGGGDSGAAFQWAPSSQAIAFRAEQELVVADLRMFPSSNHFALPAAACGERCAGAFAFQPHFGE